MTLAASTLDWIASYSRGRYLRERATLGHDEALAVAKADAAYMKEQFESGDLVDVEAEEAAKREPTTKQPTAGRAVDQLRF